MANQFSLACFLLSNAAEEMSRQSKDSALTVSFILCKKPLPTSAPLNAATALQQSSSQRKPCSTRIRTRRAIKSAKLSPAISAAAPAISKSSKPWKPPSSKSPVATNRPESRAHNQERLCRSHQILQRQDPTETQEISA